MMQKEAEPYKGITLGTTNNTFKYILMLCFALTKTLKPLFISTYK